MLGVSRTRVRQLEGHSLHPKQNESGVYQFDRAEVLRLVASRTVQPPSAKPTMPGHLVAHVFRLFRAGTPLVDIVIDTELDLESIKQLFDEYTTPLGARAQAASEAEARRESDEQEAMQREWERERRLRRT
ncbi:hypothetical protein BH11MYX4_BH11MYX4_58420 [soil metagenome]